MSKSGPQKERIVEEYAVLCDVVNCIKFFFLRKKILISSRNALKVKSLFYLDFDD